MVAIEILSNITSDHKPLATISHTKESVIYIYFSLFHVFLSYKKGGILSLLSHFYIKFVCYFSLNTLELKTIQ